MFNTLSGRFLLLTIAFVMLAEVFIFVPSIARFREDFLLSRLERAQIASLALLAAVPGERVADCFCGLGNFTLAIARSGAEAR